MSTLRYSASAAAFFDTRINGSLPNDAVEITQADHEAMMAGQAAGRAIVADAAGRPVLVDPPPPTVTEAMVRAEGDRRLRLIGQPYGEAERETWPEQVAEAQAVQADPSAPAPLLTPRAQSRAITVADMAALVLAKRDQHKAAAGAVLAAQDTILALDPLPGDFADDSRWPALPG